MSLTAYRACAALFEVDVGEMRKKQPSRSFSSDVGTACKEGILRPGRRHEALLGGLTGRSGRHGTLGLSPDPPFCCRAANFSRSIERGRFGTARGTVGKVADARAVQEDRIPGDLDRSGGGRGVARGHPLPRRPGATSPHPHGRPGRGPRMRVQPGARRVPYGWSR
jgi:hypothetical protein